jgi:hypothetical protein
MKFFFVMLLSNLVRVILVSDAVARKKMIFDMAGAGRKSLKVTRARWT